MSDNETVWLSTKDIMKRWNVTASETVWRRLKKAGVKPTLYGRVNYLRLSDVEAVEEKLGFHGIVQSLARQDTSS